MPFALTFAGLMLVITGFQDTYKQFGTLVRGDFTGSGGNNFIWWLIAVMMVGSLGYIKGLEIFSRAFLGLILFTLVIAIYKKNPGVFSSIGSGIASGSTQPTDAIGTPVTGSGGSSTSNSGGGGNILSDIGGAASIAEAIF